MNAEPRKGLLARAREAIVAKLRALDPKFVYGAVVGGGTYIVANVVGVPVETVLVTVAGVKVTYGVAIAYVAGQAAAYWKANAATILRTPQEDGNPSVAAMPPEIPVNPR
jgi:hypothetical protein